MNMTLRLATLLAFTAMLAAGCTSVTTVNGVQVDAPSGAGKSEADPRKRAEIRAELASNYYRNGQFAIALEEGQRALQADANYAPAHALLGVIYMEIGDRREAEASFGRAIKLEPDNSNILNNFGWFLCQTGRERESVAYFQRAAANRLYPTPGMALRNAGVCLLRIKDEDGAEQLLRRAFELDAADGSVKVELARLYLRKNQPDRAGFYFGLLDPASASSAPGLWLGLRIARAKADLRKERDLAMQLRQRFPDSPEAAALRRGAFDE